MLKFVLEVLAGFQLAIALAAITLSLEVGFDLVQTWILLIAAAGWLVILGLGLRKGRLTDVVQKRLVVAFALNLVLFLQVGVSELLIPASSALTDFAEVLTVMLNLVPLASIIAAAVIVFAQDNHRTDTVDSAEPINSD